MTARVAFTEADLSRAWKVAKAGGARVRLVQSPDGGRAEIILEPATEDTKSVDTNEGPKEW